MDERCSSQPRRRIAHGARRLHVLHGHPERVEDGVFRLNRQDRTDDDHRRIQPGFPQVDALLHRRDSNPVCPMPNGKDRDGTQSMPVSIRLGDEGDRGVGRTDRLTDEAKVVPQRAQVDFDPGARKSGHGAILALVHCY